MTKAVIKNTFLISLVSHAAVFSVLGLTFPRPLHLPGVTPFVFWGPVLFQSEFEVQETAIKKPFSIHSTPAINALSNAVRFPVQSVIVTYPLKPFSRVALLADKPSLLPAPRDFVNIPLKKDAGILFHPLLPYQLQLYFKDRQAVHIELAFNIVRGRQRNTIEIKRKISSGNLEADLLSARYINHYLVMQQARFSPNSWQTVKIDLSKK